MVTPFFFAGPPRPPPPAAAPAPPPPSVPQQPGPDSAPPRPPLLPEGASLPPSTTPGPSLRSAAPADSNPPVQTAPRRRPTWTPTSYSSFTTSTRREASPTGGGGGGVGQGNPAAFLPRRFGAAPPRLAPAPAPAPALAHARARRPPPLPGRTQAFGPKQILRGASFSIRRGECVGVIGGSGTGKSTSLKLAAGLLAPDSGVISIKGVPRRGLLADDPASRRLLRLGLVFQSASLFDSLTVGENVGFTLFEHTSLPDGEIARRVSEALTAVGLRGVEGLYPAELSGGMKKRVALARAVVDDREPAADADASSSGGGGEDEGASETEASSGSGAEGERSAGGGARRRRRRSRRADEDDAYRNVERLVMYDEPTAGLDPVASTVVEDLMRSLAERVDPATGKPEVAAYIVVTHQARGEDGDRPGRPRPCFCPPSLPPSSPPSSRFVPFTPSTPIVRPSPRSTRRFGGRAIALSSWTRDGWCGRDPWPSSTPRTIPT